MKICKMCVLDERFPGIRFDGNSVCNFCNAANECKDQAVTVLECERKFAEIVDQCKGRQTYDCLIAYSGGKDSTYTLQLLKNSYGLKLLAFSFDNWFQSERARLNIRTVLRNINVDHWTLTPRFDVIKSIIVASIENKSSSKALTRASSICTSCISMIRYAGFRLAVDLKIPIIAFGMSPGQAPLATAVVKTNARMTKMMQHAFLRPFSEQLRAELKPFFLEERHFNRPDDFPWSVNPLAFVEYDEGEVFRVAEQFGWNKPQDTDANSTNCLLNSLANQVHIERFGFNPYAYEIAELVRKGCMPREEGMKRLNQPLPKKQIAEVKKKLGIE